MECIIPFITANLVNQIKAGCSLNVILRYGLLLVVMAALSLTFGALAGSACATASCGFARNLRKDMFYKIQTYSFQNIDKFSVSSLVTRLTTDVTNVQNAYMILVIHEPVQRILHIDAGLFQSGFSCDIHSSIILSWGCRAGSAPAPPPENTAAAGD